MELHAGEAGGADDLNDLCASRVCTTAMVSTEAGRWGVMAATCSTVTWRLLGAKTKPSASAPSEAASWASARLVLAQILIHMPGYSEARGAR